MVAVASKERKEIGTSAGRQCVALSAPMFLFCFLFLFRLFFLLLLVDVRGQVERHI
jgi:hypothetical protein